MRAFLSALVLFATAVSAAAQSHAGGLTDDMPMPSIGLPLPHIGLPLPTIGLPLPPMGLPPAGSRPGERLNGGPRFNGSERIERSGNRDRSGRPNRLERPASFVFLGWPYLAYPQFPALPSSAPPPERPAGLLRLVLNSGVDPQIFVDGYYTGLFSDVAGELRLDAGTHVVELREEGYQNLRVPVNIQPNGLIRYDVGLRPIVSQPLPTVPQTAAPSPAVPPPTTIYVVPGCYVGNVPPRDVQLPASCDARDAIEFPSR